MAVGDNMVKDRPRCTSNVAHRLATRAHFQHLGYSRRLGEILIHSVNAVFRVPHKKSFVNGSVRCTSDASGINCPYINKTLSRVIQVFVRCLWQSFLTNASVFPHF